MTTDYKQSRPCWMVRGFRHVGRTDLTSPIRLWLGLLHQQSPHQDISSICFRASCAWILLLSLFKEFKDFFAKTLNYVWLDMGGKVFTAIESPILNRCDTIWNIYVGERVAIAKSILSNRCDTIWNSYAGERVAPPKSTLSNRCDTIWDIYAGERFAPPKSTLSNRCDTIRDIYVSERFAVSVSIISWLSMLYALNGRKVTVWILIRYEKRKI